MKIAIFSDNFYPEISGISDSVLMLGQELASMGHEIHFFGAKYSKKDYQKANISFDEPDLDPNIKFHRFWSLPMFGSPTGQSRIVIPFGIRCLKFRKEKFDLIYTQSPYGLGFEALFMAKMFKIPLIGTNHTPITEFTRYMPLNNRLFDLIGLKFVSWYYNRCQFVSAPFQGILDEMKKYGLKVPCEAISNPIDLKNFFQASEEEKQALKNKFDFTNKTVLYAGRLAPEKQVDVIVKSMVDVVKKIPQAILAITGIGNAEENLKKLAKTLGIEKNVKFFGRVDDAVHAQTYRASELFVVMSTAETQCISMMKAMSSGLPVIAADAWALPNYAGRDEKRGFVVPVGDEKRLAEKITQLLENTELSEKMGQEGISYVKQFSSRSVAEKWQEIFQKAISKNNKCFKLTFAIPAYNEEKTIKTCLQSVIDEIAGKNYDVEIIVINNASTDKTGEIALSFKGVKVIDEPKKGLTWARQAGYLNSSGDLIANIDADTKLPKGWVDKVFYEFNKDEKLVALSGPHKYYDLPLLSQIGVKIFYYLGFLSYICNYYLIRKGSMLQGGNFIVKKSALEKIGGYSLDFDFYEDTDIASRIYKEGHVKFTFSLPIYASGRRFKKEGLLWAGIKYAINHFFVLIFKKPFSQGYVDIREDGE